MDLDEECLREARLENLERLALALGLRLPFHKNPRSYGRALVRVVMRGLERDRARKYATARAA